MGHVRGREKRKPAADAKPDHSAFPMAHRASTKRNRGFFQLFRCFLEQTRGHNRMLAAALVAASIATLLGLVPLYGTKLIFDNVLGDQPLPGPVASYWPDWLAEAADKRRLLVYVTVGMVGFALVSLMLHMWSRWHATRITKRVQQDVRRRLFHHAVRLPLNRVYEIKSGGVASTLREDAGSVGDLVFAMLYNPWRAIIQLLGSLVILAFTDWRLLLGSNIGRIRRTQSRTEM